MNRFRKILFWLHLISGVAAGIFIFIMCVTGALLSFQANVLEWAESEMRYVRPPAPDAPRVGPSVILAGAQAAKPSARPTALTLQNDPSAAATVALGREGQLFVDPYTGAVTGEGARNWRAFFRTTEDLHRWLALPGAGRAVGKSLNDAANVLFLFLAVSGVYIWFPRQRTRRHFAPIIWFRRTNSGRARDFNWHNVIGFWTSAVLVVLTLTGVVISYQWAGNLVYTLTGNAVPPAAAPAPNAPNAGSEKPFAPPANIDALFAAATAHTAWKSVSLRLPANAETAVFTIDEGIYANRFGRSTLTLDAGTAAVAKWEPYSEQNAGRRLRSWIRFTHTGESFGLIGQLVGFVACLGGAVLVYTGLALALRRLGGWRARRAAAEN